MFAMSQIKPYRPNARLYLFGQVPFGTGGRVNSFVGVKSLDFIVSVAEVFLPERLVRRQTSTHNGFNTN